MKTNNWIQKAIKGRKKGLLHKQLGIPSHERIPNYILETIVNTDIGRYISYGHKDIKITKLLKRRAIFALNIRK